MSDLIPPEILQFAPAVAVLLYITIRQQQQIDRLVTMIVDCYQSSKDTEHE